MMNGELNDIVFNTKRGRAFTDGTTIGGIICPLIKMRKWDVYIYGGGTDISTVVLYFWNLGIDIKGIIDLDPNKDGKRVLEKIPIISPSKISKKFNSEKTFVIINTIYFRGIEQYEIICLLKRLGIEKFYELNEWEKIEM